MKVINRTKAEIKHFWRTILRNHKYKKIVMVLFNLTSLHLLQHSFCEHLFNVYVHGLKTVSYYYFFYLQKNK